MRKLIVLLFTVVLTAQASPVRLRLNGLTNPLGIDTPRPTFSWQSDAKTANWMQSAYELLVATREGDLLPGKADAWDSGKVNASESVDIAYAGAVLKPQQRYVWKVITWDAKGVRSASLPAWFETGLMSATDWKAQWITRTDAADQRELEAIRWVWLPKADAQHVPSATKVQFAYHLALQAKPQAASLHAMVRGEYTATVNGHVTGHHDGWGAFDREEIAGYLHEGENEIRLDVTSHRAKSTAPAAIAATIHITYADGRQERLVTGDSTAGGAWQVRTEASDAWEPVAAVGPLSMDFGIGLDRDTPIPGPKRITTDASLLRKDFNVASAVKTARLSITALGAYEAFVNGQSVAPNTLLAPGWTDFHKRVLYQTYDVSTLVKPGANALGVMLGGGWYSSPMTWVGYRDTPGPNLLRAQLDITFADGRHESVVTDPSWSVAAAPVTFSEIYGGESYDARLLQSGWDRAGFKETGWTVATAAMPPDVDVQATAQPDLPISTTMTVKPVKLDAANAAHPYIFDMGQNMVGNLRIHVHGVRGTVVRLRYAERLNPDGSIYVENLRNADATDTYALSGQGEETWTPAFTFHGFRYVEFEYLGAPQAMVPTLATIEGLVYNSLPEQPSIRFASSSETLNKMNELGDWGQRGNFVSIPTDCPQRDERLGWMGDAGVFWRTGSYNFDIESFTHKFMLDVIDAQKPNGAFTDVSPDVLKQGDAPGAPGWGDAGVFIPYAAWLQYGDRATVQRSWPAMERWMDFILKSNPDYLRRKELGNNYGDWLAPDEHTPKDLIGTAYWALIAHQMMEMARALGRSEDTAKYQQQYEHIAAAYLKAFVKEDGTVEGNTQSSYLATLFTGIAPPALRAAMVERLVKDIEAHGNHLTTGFLGTPFLMFVLDENKQSDLAFKLLLSDTYPSWGYMVKKGATTWWERWNGDTGDPEMNSYNHYAFGSVMAWVYRRAAGIDTDATGPGYHQIVVRPHFDASLPKLHVEYDSAYGTIVSDWSEAKHQFTLTIPANTTAMVSLPDGRTETVGSGVHQYSIAK
jgi:alpha-L-rhamnosidase